MFNLLKNPEMKRLRAQVDMLETKQMRDSMEIAHLRRSLAMAQSTIASLEIKIHSNLAAPTNGV